MAVTRRWSAHAGTGDHVRRIVIDTDPGVDDSMSIQAALRSPEVRIEALTTVFGNRGVGMTTRNALINLEQAERTDIPVASGASKPLSRNYVEPEVPGPHGRDGLGDCRWPPPRARAIETPAAALIVEHVLRSPGEITLLAIAPLTNLALALALEPRIARQVQEVVVMGGVIEPAEDDPVAEFNFRNDPEATHKVLHAGWPLVMVGLDLTRKVAMTPEHLQQIRRARTRASDFVSKIVPVYFDWCRGRYHKEVLYPHDVCGLAYLIDPSLFVTESLYIDIEVHDSDTLGKTVARFPENLGQKSNVKVCRAVSSERLLQMFIDRITA